MRELTAGELRSLRPQLARHIDPPNENGCRLWTGATNNRYGSTSKIIAGHKRYFIAHRLVWQIKHGPLAPEKLVCHKCDVRLCCELTHLFVGSAKDNTADMMAKGRQVMRGTRGEQSGNAKLTEVQVREILRLYAAGARQVDLGVQFGSSQAQVSRIVRRESWAHLDLSEGPQGEGDAPPGG